VSELPVKPEGPNGLSNDPTEASGRWWRAGRKVVLIIQGLAGTATIVGVLATNGCGPI